MASKTCKVCTVPIRFQRLGADACRACAAFFKRTKATGKIFICRQGNGRCTFRKHEKFMCKMCRFEKCLEIGMEYRAELKEEDEEEREFPSTSVLAQKERVLLEEMKQAYYDSFDRRIAMERDLAHRLRLQRVDHPTEEFYANTLQFTNQQLPGLVHEIVHLFTSVFPCLRRLDLEDKEALFQTFVGKFSMVEGFYRTSKYMDTASNFMLSLITCVDPEIDWIQDDHHMPNKRDFKMLADHYAYRYETLHHPAHRKESFSETEFIALLILQFCDVDLTLELGDDVLALLEIIRKAIFSELREYYRREGRTSSDYSMRIGKLMTMALMTCEAGTLLNEESRTYATLFEFHSIDLLLNQILSGRTQYVSVSSTSTTTSSDGTPPTDPVAQMISL